MTKTNHWLPSHFFFSQLPQLAWHGTTTLLFFFFENKCSIKIERANKSVSWLVHYCFCWDSSISGQFSASIKDRWSLLRQSAHVRTNLIWMQSPLRWSRHITTGWQLASCVAMTNSAEEHRHALFDKQMPEPWLHSLTNRTCLEALSCYLYHKSSWDSDRGLKKTQVYYYVMFVYASFPAGTLTNVWHQTWWFWIAVQKHK